jgi:hypothetical protein
MVRPSTTRRAGCAIAAALFLWLTTFDCLTCCVADGLRGEEGACSVVQGAEPSSCCVARVEPSGDDSLRRASTETADRPCPLLPTSYGVSESSRPEDSSVAVLPAGHLDRDVCSPSLRPVPPREPARIANRGDTYMRCCVLLI